MLDRAHGKPDSTHKIITLQAELPRQALVAIITQLEGSLDSVLLTRAEQAALVTLPKPSH